MEDREGIVQRLQEGLTVAIKAKDSVAMSALRSALSAIANAEAVAGTLPPEPGHAIAKSRLGVGAGDVARRELSDRDLIVILRAEMDERIRAAEDYERSGETERAGRLRAEAAVLRNQAGSDT